MPEKSTPTQQSTNEQSKKGKDHPRKDLPTDKKRLTTPVEVPISAPENFWTDMLEKSRPTQQSTTQERPEGLWNFRPKKGRFCWFQTVVQICWFQPARFRWLQSGGWFRWFLFRFETGLPWFCWFKTVWFCWLVAIFQFCRLQCSDFVVILLVPAMFFDDSRRCDFAGSRRWWPFNFDGSDLLLPDGLI